MNEITRIQLGRVPYNIDVAAKKELENYCAAIRRSLGADKDVYDDIEIRMTEILTERGVHADGVITGADVAALRAQLGEPKEFKGDESDEKDSENWRDNMFTRGKDGANRPPRKFYRDEDNAVLGGLAAGLAAYTGWDVVLWRIIFVILIPLTSGFAILLYIIMWIAAPAARTASEKLEMRGEPVNLDSIKESARNFGHRAGEVMDEAADKTASAASELGKKAEKVGPKFGHIVGRIIAVCAGLFVLAIGVAVMVGAIAGAFALTLGAIAVGPIGVWFVIAGGLGLLAAFAFAILCFMLAGICFRGKIGRGTKRASFINSLILIIALLAACMIGGGWLATHTPTERQNTWNEIASRADVVNANYTETLNITGPRNVEIDYRISDKADISVDNVTPKEASKMVTITKGKQIDANVAFDWNASHLLRIEKAASSIDVKVADSWRSTCGKKCPSTLKIQLSGPAASVAVMANKLSFVYNVPDDASFAGAHMQTTTFSARGGARISSGYGYSYPSITATDKSTIDLSAVSLNSSSIDISGGSTVRLGDIANADIYTPKTCDTPSTINIQDVSDNYINVNEDYHELRSGSTFTGKCLEVNVGK